LYLAGVAADLPGVHADDVIELQVAGWDDEAIYFTITTCALFHFTTAG
jgi:hypothetical protein